MNIENIIALEQQLHALGVENTGSILLKRICFKPEHFFLTEKKVKEKELFTLHFYFERDAKKNIYECKFYDAQLQKEITESNPVINSIDIAALEKLFRGADWKNAFDFASKKQLNWQDASGWEKDLLAEEVAEQITALEKTAEGIKVAAALKLKYWNGFLYQEAAGSMPLLKSKAEIAQRFYISEGHEAITVDEAYRFLKNRLLDKQFQQRKKQTEIPETDETLHGDSGPLKKKTVKKKRTGKSK